MKHPFAYSRGLAAASLLFLFAAFAPCALAQTPGTTVTVLSNEQPEQGPGQEGVINTLSRDDSTTWSKHPSAADGSGMGWSHVLLADLDGDERDDLCGSYGLANGDRVYGCVLNDRGKRTFSGSLIQATAFNGPLNDSIHSTMTVIDLNSDNDRHLCGRTSGGVKCQRFNGSGFDAAVSVQLQFRDYWGWDQPQYYSTIRFGKIRGILTLCARGVEGILCYRKSGSDFHTTPIRQRDFSDANRWNEPQYYRTLQYVDIDGDGHLDICARGRSGIVCAEYWYERDMFRYSTIRTGQFSDRYGWHDPRYYLSVRFGDVNGDGSPDVCGRGGAGMYCGIWWGAEPFSAFTLAESQMSDAANWGNPTSDLDSLLIADFDGDGKNDVCGLKTPAQASPEFFCARSQSVPTAPAVVPTAARFDPLVRRIKNVGRGSRVLAGRIYPSRLVSGIRQRATGFCWAQTDGAVRCSVEWQEQP